MKKKLFENELYKFVVQVEVNESLKTCNIKDF